MGAGGGDDSCGFVLPRLAHIDPRAFLVDVVSTIPPKVCEFKIIRKYYTGRNTLG
jgi:hypothetical protein